MKMIWIGIAAAIVLAVVCGFALQSANVTTTARYQTENVRL